MTDLDELLAIVAAHDPVASKEFREAFAIEAPPDFFAAAYMKYAADDPAFIVESVRIYLDGDELSRQEMLYFLEGNHGPEVIQKSIDGTPTTRDLNEWVGDQFKE